MPSFTFSLAPPPIRPAPRPPSPTSPAPTSHSPPLPLRSHGTRPTLIYPLTINLHVQRFPSPTAAHYPSPSSISPVNETLQAYDAALTSFESATVSVELRLNPAPYAPGPHYSTPLSQSYAKKLLALSSLVEMQCAAASAFEFRHDGHNATARDSLAEYAREARRVAGEVLVESHGWAFAWGRHAARCAEVLEGAARSAEDVRACIPPALVGEEGRWRSVGLPGSALMRGYGSPGGAVSRESSSSGVSECSSML